MGFFSWEVGTGFALGVFAQSAIKGDCRGFWRNFFGFSICVSRLFAITYTDWVKKARGM
jgi:hypothetical protein